MLPLLLNGGVRAVTPTGVLGDPTAATASEDVALLDRLAEDLLSRVDRWRTPAGSVPGTPGEVVPR